MNTNELIILNFEEIRRRSIIVWKAVPQHLLTWKPDDDALSCGEMIRHVLEGEFFYHQILLAKGSTSLSKLANPFDNKTFISVEDELHFIQPYRFDFINDIRKIDEKELSSVNIDRSDVGYIRTLGDMLLRIAYHESVHTGQLLDYMRTAGIERPNIWD